MDDALTRSEQAALEAAGWVYAGGGLGDGGQPYLRFRRRSVEARGSRGYWRAVIAELPTDGSDLVQDYAATLARAEAARSARLQATHADLLRVAQAADAEARQQRGALRAALQSILAIAEARSDGTWDDVMRTARAALDGKDHAD
jgi:hypothetical protein